MWEAAGTLQIAVTEYRLKPDSARASAGSLVIVVHNYGRLTHDLVISQNGQTEESTKPLAPGQSAVLSVDLSPGKYDWPRRSTPTRISARTAR